MSGARCDVGVVGLGVMGGGLARNLASRGYRVAIFSRSRESAQQVAAAHPEAALRPASDLGDLVRSIERPRRILLLVPAGEPVDAVLGALDALLDGDDVVVDAGNSHFADTERRCAWGSALPWHFIGMGVSGGAEGALHGPSLMPGGDDRGWPLIRPICEAIAAPSDRGPCVSWCGRGGAGHFVKMIHNGIEYADMQILAESALLLRRGLSLPPSALPEVFEAWNQSELESFLVETAARVFRVPDPGNPGAPLLDAVLDRAAQKGTGRWTVQAALALGIPSPVIACAVDARSLSADAAVRARAQVLVGDGDARQLAGVSVEDVRSAFYASRIVAYAEGFAVLGAAIREHSYGTDLAEIARIWRGGCIIRARVLDRIIEALAAAGETPSLALVEPLRGELALLTPAWRRVVGAAAGVGVPVPAMSASLGWIDTVRTAPGSADLIQALRDAFGAHGYERRDRPGELVHSAWQLPREP